MTWTVITPHRDQPIQAFSSWQNLCTVFLGVLCELEPKSTQPPRGVPGLPCLFHWPLAQSAASVGHLCPSLSLVTGVSSGHCSYFQWVLLCIVSNSIDPSSHSYQEAEVPVGTLQSLCPVLPHSRAWLLLSPILSLGVFLWI